MSLFEAVLIAALIIYSLFLLAILIEYLTDKRGQRKLMMIKSQESEEIPPPPGSAEKGSTEEGAPKQWKEEEFE